VITSDLLTDLKSVLPDVLIEDGKQLIDTLGNNSEIIIYPTTEEEIGEILKFANDNGKKVTVTGLGSKRGFGGIEASSDILLSLKEYHGIVEHVVGDMTMTVKAGTRFQELQEYLATHKQTIPLDPAWPEHATIGGIIAANDSGPKRLGYGSARDLVIGLRIVYPDGEIIRSGGRVVKNVAGYDMNKMFVGSMGTLGVFSDITLKLRPLPKYESLVLLSFTDDCLEEIRTFTVSLLDSLMEPNSLELLSPSTSMALTGQSNYALAISFEDVEKSVRYQEEFVERVKPDNAEMAILAQSDAQMFWQEFYKITPNGFTEVQDDLLEVSLKVGVKNLDVLKVVQAAHLLEENELHVQAHGGLGHGLCGVNLKGTAEQVERAIRSLTQSVEELGGYMVIKHAPLELRQTLEVWGKKPTFFFLFEGIKNKVDPLRTLNDKRFVGGL